MKTRTKKQSPRSKRTDVIWHSEDVTRRAILDSELRSQQQIKAITDLLVKVAREVVRLDRRLGK